jgi:hydrogenase maturation protein HypF
MQKRISIDVSGIVQGVGFRPHIYRLANRLNLVGNVRNNSHGVNIEIQGTIDNIEHFIKSLKNQPPPLAQITAIHSKGIPCKKDTTFKIIKSQKFEQRTTFISPDIATCADCLTELLSKDDRRYLYPFINCTNCGPRFTIINDIPYDRPKTSMASFKMCTNCQNEYDDPTNRRFHAQPNACYQCGPQVICYDEQGKVVSGDAIEHVVIALEQGKIVAIKGLGGFHLAVDARNDQAVCALRERKHRFEKPLALMVSNVKIAASIAYINSDEEIMLESLQRPIVLCKKRSGAYISRHISLDNDYIGIMLPYTPLHEVIFKKCRLNVLVMTSANMSEEPICYQNEECLGRMGNVADYFLAHNRDIFTRCDDSVLRSFRGKPSFIRRSRGFIPRPILLSQKGPSILAVGGHLKNTVCLTKDKYAFVSQHIGDLENLATLIAFEHTIAHLQNIFEINPQYIIHDFHPDYLSTKWVFEHAKVPYLGVQHHFAHILSVMAEQGLKDNVLGFALDGTGFGSDGTIWGGEVLICNIGSFERYAYFKTVPMPGGEKAIQEPWRMAVAYIQHYLAPQKETLLKLFPQHSGEIDVIIQMMQKSINAPLTSSCGRLFDAVAAILRIRDRVSYEGQAAIILEAQAQKHREESTPDIGKFKLVKQNNRIIIDASEIINATVTLMLQGKLPQSISRAFHKALIEVFTEIAVQVYDEKNIRNIALSGGCFQNMLLLEGLYRALKKKGFHVYTNEQVPVNDGGISLGQAYWGIHNAQKMHMQQ